MSAVLGQAGRRLAVWAAGAVLCVACVDRTPENLSPNVVILNSDHVDLPAQLCTRMLPAGVLQHRQATEREVLEAEARIERFLWWNAPQEIVDRMAEYKRQYVGIGLNGTPALYLNAFLEPEGGVPGWNERFVGVCDGGWRAWGVIYDVVSREFRDLEVNSE